MGEHAEELADVAAEPAVRASAGAAVLKTHHHASRGAAVIELLPPRHEAVRGRLPGFRLRAKREISACQIADIVKGIATTKRYRVVHD